MALHACYDAAVSDQGRHAGPESLSGRLQRRVAEAIAAAGGWLRFERFMALALYEPGLGYYARGGVVFGAGPESGSDFVTAPELTPLFGRALARQVAQVLQALQTPQTTQPAQAGEIVEFGAGSGALAEQLLDALGERVTRYAIVDVSGALRSRQQQRLARFGPRVVWLDALPAQIRGVVLGNEVLDAMPVTLLHFDGHAWHERGVALDDQGALVWADRPTALRPPEAGTFVPGTLTEIHPQAEAFVRTLAERLVQGAAFFIDYGFPQAEYYLPQRHMGTLVCHRGHLVDADPLADVGDKDITAHVDFTGIALAAQDAGLEVVGYTSQARFLLNCGLPALLQGAEARTLAAAGQLLNEHEMGELFKVIGLARDVTLPAGEDWLGFIQGDRTHRL